MLRLPAPKKKREAEGNSGCTCCSLRLLCCGVSTCSHGCCVAVCVGSRDNRETIHTRSDCCLQPLSLSARSLRELHHLFLCLSTSRRRFLSATLYPLYPQSVRLSVFPSLPPPFPPPPLSILCFFSLQPSLSLFFFAFQLTQKHKQQQLGAVIVLLWNSIAFSVKDGVVNNKLHIRKGKKKKALQCEPGQQVSERLNRRPWRLRVWAV